MDRIKINGIWYVPENSQDVVIIEPDREECYTIENSDFYFKAIRFFDQENNSFFDDIDIHFIDKRYNKPKEQDTWDNNDWMIGVLKGDEASMVELPDIGRSGLATLRAFLQYLVDKDWLKTQKNDSSNI
jgi:hypothetical protein